MSNKCIGTISVDVDTLASIFKGSRIYTNHEYREGLENLHDFLASYDIAATLFCVGKDFTVKKNQAITKAIAKHHEIANHTFSHPQGLRFLSFQEKVKEISQFETVCSKLLGKKPTGFRSPGWNIDNEIASILIKRGYRYDASIFPTSLTPFLKILHFFAMSKRQLNERTTLGQLNYMLAPIRPYTTKRNSFFPGNAHLQEFPVSVTPIFRLPFSATFALKLGFNTSKKLYQAIKSHHLPLQFMFHLFDFVDFSRPSCQAQINHLFGSYVSKSLRTPYKVKMELWKRLLDLFVRDYQFVTYQQRCDL